MRFDALRQPASAVRLARALWILWAFLLWNVVFDHVIVVAGRDYIAAADRAAMAPPPRHYVNMDDWMRPAVTRAWLTASAGAAAVLATGMLAVGAAARRASGSLPQVTPCA